MHLIELSSGDRMTFQEESFRTHHAMPCIVDGERCRLRIRLFLYPNGSDVDPRLPYLAGQCSITGATLLTKIPNPEIAGRTKVGHFPVNKDGEIIHKHIERTVLPASGESFQHPIHGDVRVVVRPDGHFDGDTWVWGHEDREGFTAVTEEEARDAEKAACDEAIASLQDEGTE